MSLISEGLRKAHLETLRQDRERRRQYLGPGRTDVPPRAAPWAATLGMAALGGAIVAGGVAVYLVKSSSPTIGVPASLTAATPAPAAAETQEAPAPVSRPPRAAHDPEVKQKASVAVPASALKEKSVEPKMAPQPVAKTDSPRRDRETAGTETAAAVAQTETAPAVVQDEQPPRLRRRDSFEDGKTYMTPIRAPGGGEVALSGVSSLRGQVVALMNGVIVREGSTVGPFVVERIERGRVQLRYIDIRFWLTY